MWCVTISLTDDKFRKSSVLCRLTGTYDCRMFRIARALTVSLLFALSFVTPARAQVGGSISGTIKDPSGGVIPGVTVTATNTTLGTMFNTITDGQGLYSFPKLPVARYELTMQID